MVTPFENRDGFPVLVENENNILNLDLGAAGRAMGIKHLEVESSLVGLLSCFAVKSFHFCSVLKDSLSHLVGAKLQTILVFPNNFSSFLHKLMVNTNFYLPLSLRNLLWGGQVDKALARLAITDGGLPLREQEIVGPNPTPATTFFRRWAPPLTEWRDEYPVFTQGEGRAHCIKKGGPWQKEPP